MNIALIVHFTPRTLRETRGRGHVVLSSEMAGGKKKKISRKGHTPHVRHGREGEGEKGGGRCVCVCGDIQKRQDPVSKHLFRL